MNYARVRAKLKEKSKALRSLSGSDRAKAEKTIIESESKDTELKPGEQPVQESEPGPSPVQEPEPEPVQGSEPEPAKSYKGKKRGPKRRK